MSCVATGSRKRKEHGELFGFQNVKKHSAKGTNTSDAEQTLDKQVDMSEMIS